MTCFCVRHRRRLSGYELDHRGRLDLSGRDVALAESPMALWPMRPCAPSEDQHVSSARDATRHGTTTLLAFPVSTPPPEGWRLRTTLAAHARAPRGERRLRCLYERFTYLRTAPSWCGSFACRTSPSVPESSRSLNTSCAPPATSTSRSTSTWWRAPRLNDSRRARCTACAATTSPRVRRGFAERALVAPTSNVSPSARCSWPKAAPCCDWRVHRRERRVAGGVAPSTRGALAPRARRWAAPRAWTGAPIRLVSRAAPWWTGLVKAWTHWATSSDLVNLRAAGARRRNRSRG